MFQRLKKGRDEHPGLLFYGERILYYIIRPIIKRLLQLQFIDPTAVGTAADTVILGIGPFQGMTTAGDRIGFLRPTGAAGDTVLFDAIDVESQVIVIAFG